LIERRPRSRKSPGLTDSRSGLVLTITETMGSACPAPEALSSP
jgi:hypothetical protein